jgi:hypothetical protein
MSVEIKKEIQLEIAHVLFIDIVGYSRGFESHPFCFEEDIGPRSLFLFRQDL